MLCSFSPDGQNSKKNKIQKHNLFSIHGTGFSKLAKNDFFNLVADCEKRSP